MQSPHCSKNISYRRICSDDEAFEKRVKDLSEHLNKRGYQKQVIDQAIEKVRHTSPIRQQTKLFCHLSWHITQNFLKSGASSINIGPSSNHQIIWAQSSHRNQSWPSDDQKTSEIILYGLDWSQIPSMMSLLENANPVADQDVKPAKW